MAEVFEIAGIVFLLAIVISLIVAVLIKGVVMALPLFEGSGGASAVATPGPAPTPAADRIPPDHIAAITAAVSSMMGTQNILHIEDRGRGAVWTAEGRLMHHTSHAITRRSKR